MRAVWSDRPNCSHNVSQKVKRIGRLSEKTSFSQDMFNFDLQDSKQKIGP